MGLIQVLENVWRNSKQEYRRIVDSGYSRQCQFTPVLENRGHDAGNSLHLQQDPWVNRVASADNLDFMCYLLREGGLKNKIKMIYIDPPFFTTDNFGARINLEPSKKGETGISLVQKAYSDHWMRDPGIYLEMLTLRLLLMRDLLSDKGCIFVHLDWHAVHGVKLILDEIFGEENFRNEIIWTYKSGGATNRRFARKHDTILFYSKTKDYEFFPQKEKSYNRDFRAYKFKGVEEFQDKLGWYTMVNQKDVWAIDMVGRSAKERIGYASQKPEVLLERIIKSCTRENDICADFFCGSGTTAAVAARLNRRFLCGDLGKLAISKTIKRLGQNSIPFQLLEPDDETNFKFQPSLEVLQKEDILFAENYWIDLKKADLSPKSLEAGEKALRKAPLSFLDYMAVDFQYDGKTFRTGPDPWQNEVEKGVRISAGVKNYDTIAVLAADVFGNRMIREVRQ